MWKGFFGFLLFMVAFCGIFLGFAMFVGGIGIYKEGNPNGQILAICGGMILFASFLTCRVLIRALHRAFEEDAKNPPPAQYVPGKHRHDPD